MLEILALSEWQYILLRAEKKKRNEKERVICLRGREAEKNQSLVLEMLILTL